MTESELEAILERFADVVARKLANELSTTWLTREEYAHRFKVSLRTVDKLIATEAVEVKRRGSRVYLANIDAWQASSTKATEAGKATGSAITGRRSRNQSGSVL